MYALVKMQLYGSFIISIINSKKQHIPLKETVDVIAKGICFHSFCYLQFLTHHIDNITELYPSIYTPTVLQLSTALCSGLTTEQSRISWLMKEAPDVG